MAGVVIVVIYIGTIRSTTREVGEFGGIIRRIAFSYMQMLGVLGIFKARGTAVFNEWIGKSSEIGGGSFTSMVAVKCALESQVYGPFLLNMSSPFIIAILVFVVLLPMTFCRRFQESSKRKRTMMMAERREMAALGDVVLIPPRWEPIIDVGGLCGGIPRAISLKTLCCRKPAGEEYIRNTERKAVGQAPLAPLTRAVIPIDTFIGAGIPHALLLALPCCRVKTTEEERSLWRVVRAVKDHRVPFKRSRRFVSVMVLFMYSLYPTLVASTASIFNCSDPIEGKQYLLADLTVVCFEGRHLLFLAMAIASVCVYCIGTPLVFAVLMSYELCVCHSPKCKDTELPWRRRFCIRCKCNCKLRSSTPWGYRIASVREQFGLLVAGYDMERGALVMAWEPLVVMLRKLFVTLAGSVPRDPYLQITIALVILIGSMMLQALVQPYESRLLNILDVISLFVLIITQCLSILYLYLDSLPDGEPLPLSLDRGTVEIGMTLALFAANISVVVLLLGAYVVRITFEKIRKIAMCVKKPHATSSSTDSDDGGTELARLHMRNPIAMVRDRQHAASGAASKTAPPSSPELESVEELKAKIAKLCGENDALKEKNERLQFEQGGAVVNIAAATPAPANMHNPMHRSVSVTVDDVEQRDAAEVSRLPTAASASASRERTERRRPQTREADRERKCKETGAPEGGGEGVKKRAFNDRRAERQRVAKEKRDERRRKKREATAAAAAAEPSDDGAY